ncbi:MAG TPA: hypothetical protein RMI62_09850, partial [Polyangiaceae bacterium LLY-WYZ-15_(1-7)]|nr:hypothetical protein [Polyangiaceae bacterium LLY-WYZ-15_(1-7)]
MTVACPRCRYPLHEATGLRPWSRCERCDAVHDAGREAPRPLAALARAFDALGWPAGAADLTWSARCAKLRGALVRQRLARSHPDHLAALREGLAHLERRAPLPAARLPEAFAPAPAPPDRATYRVAPPVVQGRLVGTPWSGEGWKWMGGGALLVLAAAGWAHPLPALLGGLGLFASWLEWRIAVKRTELEIESQELVLRHHRPAGPKEERVPRSKIEYVDVARGDGLWSVRVVRPGWLASMGVLLWRTPRRDEAFGLATKLEEMLGLEGREAAMAPPRDRGEVPVKARVGELERQADAPPGAAVEE